MLLSRLQELKLNLQEALEAQDEYPSDEDLELGALVLLNIDPGDYTYGDYNAMAREIHASGCGDVLYGLNEAGYFPEFEASDVKEWLSERDESYLQDLLDDADCSEEELEDYDYTRWVELKNETYKDFIRWLVTKEE